MLRLCVALALGTPGMSASEASSGKFSAGKQVALTVKGRGVAGDANGTFALTGAVSDSDTSHVIGNTNGAQSVFAVQHVFNGKSRGTGSVRRREG
jgi:hypothetical protein